MKFKEGDKVKIIKRLPGNITGSCDCFKPNGDVGKIGKITDSTSPGRYCVRDDDFYFGYFQNIELELCPQSLMELIEDG